MVSIRSRRKGKVLRLGTQMETSGVCFVMFLSMSRNTVTDLLLSAGDHTDHGRFHSFALPKSQNKLVGVERLRVTTRSIALHPTQAHQRQKCFFPKPPFCTLGLEGIHNETDLFLILFRFEWDEHVWLPHIAVVLRNLILQDQVVTKSVPGQFRDQPMILMRIPTVVSKNEVRRDRLQLLKHFLDFGAGKRHETVVEGLQHRTRSNVVAQEQFGCPLRLGLADSGSAKHHPLELTVGIALRQPKNRAAAANFDIVGMRAEAQNGWSSANPSKQVQTHHARTEMTWGSFEDGFAVWPQIFHGAVA